MRIYLRLLVVSLLLFVGNIVYAEAQQEKRVTGTVTSEGEPLPGVSVQLKGASSGTITDIDGKYSIEVLATGTLVFRFVGMRTVEQPVNNRSVINVTLESESKELEEVMVVAYATAKKYSFTGAASTMKAGEIEKLQTSSISRILEGTVSGVQASAASGQPGTDAEIRIRGIGSINASSAPLYVVDGVPFDGSVNSINPDDISSMTVLKDAASAALYGSRGANGVIIITTKQGDQNTKATVKVKASLGGSNRAVRDYDRVSTDQYFELYWEALRNQYAKSADYTPATAATQASKDLVTKLMGGGPNPYGPQYAQPVGTDGKLVAGARSLWNSDWSDAMEQQALRTELNLSVSGGGKAPIVHVKKGDTASRLIVFSLCSGSSPVTLDPSTDTATVNAALGGKSYIAACTVSDGRANLALPSSFTSEAGRAECELCICSADADKREVLYTPTFYLDIADNLDSSTAIEAEDRYTGLSALVTAGAQNAQKAENAAAARRSRRPAPAGCRCRRPPRGGQSRRPGALRAGRPGS